MTRQLLIISPAMIKELENNNFLVPSLICHGCGQQTWKSKRKIKCPVCGALRKEKHILYIRSKYSDYWNRRCKEALSFVIKLRQGR